MKRTVIALVLVMFMLAGSSAFASEQLFDAPNIYFSHSNAKDTEFGDFNDDGIVDIVQGQSFTKLLLFHIGNGDGTFQSLYPFAINNYNSGDYLSVGDINGDGLDDLVTLGPQFTSYVRLYLSDEASSAVPNLAETPVMINVGSWMHHLALVDEDHDGDLDIVLGGDYTGSVALFNNGDGTFSDLTSLGGVALGELINADLNHDGFPDFVKLFGTVIIVTLSDGSSGYEVADTVTLTDRSRGPLALFDLTGDGELDLVCPGANATYDEFWVEIATNLGEGTFTDGIRYDILPTGYEYVSTGDFFGDGYADIISLNRDDYTYVIISNTGGPSFEAAVEYPGQFRLESTVAYDFNNDGYDDLLGQGFSHLGVYLNHGDGTFSELSTNLVDFVGSGSFQLHQVVSNDFNGDTYPDIVVFGQAGAVQTSPHFFRIYYNDGAGDFTGDYDQFSGGGTNYWKSIDASHMACGNFIGDGSMDMVVFGDGRYMVHTGPIASGNFLSSEEFELPGQSVGIAADVDRDNDLDLVIGSSNDLLVKYNDNGVHSFDTLMENLSTFVITAIDTVDIDHDGDLDLFLGSQVSKRCATLENDGSGNFSALQELTVTAPASGAPPYGSKLIDVVAADFNNDGYGDAAILWQHLQSQTTGLVAQSVYLLMNDGAGTLSVVDTLHHLEAAKNIVAADFDNDGDYDLTLIGSYPRGPAILINDGTGSFEPGIAYSATGPGGRGVQLTADDFDKDGNLDIAVLQDRNANSNTKGTIAILHNTGDASNGSCCSGVVGDANGLSGDEPSIGDVAIMIDAKFISLYCDGLITCLEEADINQSGGTSVACEDITIGDVSILIDYMFISQNPALLLECL